MSINSLYKYLVNISSSLSYCILFFLITIAILCKKKKKIIKKDADHFKTSTGVLYNLLLRFGIIF